jgi:hypothetical protein
MNVRLLFDPGWYCNGYGRWRDVVMADRITERFQLFLGAAQIRTLRQRVSKKHRLIPCRQQFLTKFVFMVEYES